MKHAMDNPLRQHYAISQQQLLAALGISRQAYHQQRQRQQRRAAREALALEIVRQIRQHHPRMGTRKLHHLLKERHCAIGRDRLFRLLSEHELLIQPKRSYRRTTYAGLYRWPNLLPALRLERVGQLWVADITYLATADGFAYLALVTDAYSRYIVGYDLCASLALEGAQRALQMALDHAQHPRQGLIHHSDHGVQYTARPYTDLLQAHGLRPSMGEVGNAYDNALAERVNGILKLEYLLDQQFSDLRHAEQTVGQSIWLYNHERPHLNLDMQRPAQVHYAPAIPSLKQPLAQRATA